MTFQPKPRKDSSLEECFRALRIVPGRIPGEWARAVRLGLLSPLEGTRRELVTDPEVLALGPMDRRFEGAPAEFGPPRDFTPAKIRASLPRAVLSGSSWLSRWQQNSSAHTAGWVSGFGNLGMNPGTLALHQGVLLGARGGHDGWIVFDAKGAARVQDAAPRADAGAHALAGPLLVRAGKPVRTATTSWPDPRHLLLFPFLTGPASAAYHWGLKFLLEHPAVYSAAVDGKKVEIPLQGGGPTPNAPVTGQLQAALFEKGYIETASPSAPGTYRLGGDTLEIVMLSGIYPHHLLVGQEGEVPGEIFITGASNRAGIEIPVLAEALARAGFDYALVLDNGADIGLYCAPESRFEIPPPGTGRQENWSLSAVFIHRRPLGSDDLGGRFGAIPAPGFLWKANEGGRC